MNSSHEITIEKALQIAQMLHQQGRLEEAKTLYIKLLDILPNDANIYGRIGTIFDAQGKLEEAINFYQKAIALNPDFTAAHYNLANAYRDISRLDEALPHYRHALELNSNHIDALACYHHTLQHVCDWDKYSALTQKLDAANKAAIKAGERTPETPFVHITRCDNQQVNLQVANNWANYIKNAAGITARKYSFADRKRKKEKLKIAYLSRDFQDRPTGHLARKMFALHNRENFEVTAYSYGKDDNSDYRNDIKEGCDHFIDIDNMNFIEAAQKIYDDGIDILVDLQGYMAGTRLEIAAMHPAPVQVSYLGFPGTIGGRLFDYTIADRICIPENQQQFFDEKIAYMPNCYQVNNNSQEIADKKYTRSDFGLPESGFVFCSFNWSHKLDPKMFAVWMEILKEIPDSVLWLWKSSNIAEKNLCNFAEKHEVKRNRLIFAEKLPKAEHLARLKLADLALDTRIYGGHTTTSDALWADLPVITLMGKHFASRVCASLLTNIGMSELITNSLEEYKNLAINIAKNPESLQTLKSKLAANIKTEPLFDTARFVNDLEQLYQKIWNDYVRTE